MASVLITNFVSDEAAQAFIKWYEGQGEQDSYQWFDINEIPSQTVDCALTYNHPNYYLKQDEHGNWLMVLKNNEDCSI